MLWQLNNFNCNEISGTQSLFKKLILSSKDIYQWAKSVKKSQCIIHLLALRPIF